MTIVHLDVELHPEPHGFRAVLNRAGRAVVAKGHNVDHAGRLAVYQRQVHLAGLDWIEDHDGRWAHFEDPVFLGAAFWLRRPTTYRATEMWHRTARPDRTSLLRAVEDALTRVFYYDDGQVADGRVAKVLVDRAAAEHVEVWVAPVRLAAIALDLMAARLPTPPHPTPVGSEGPPEATAYLPPVLSDARSQTSGRSIPGQSSPRPRNPFRSVPDPFGG